MPNVDTTGWIVDETQAPTRGFPHPSVKVIVRIRENATGLVREMPESLGFGVDEDRPFDFGWREGNFACDCNRRLFFRRAAGEDDDEDSVCSDDKFAVQLANPKDGKTFYDEFEAAN